jgi:hypothetical protein
MQGLPVSDAITFLQFANVGILKIHEMRQVLSSILRLGQC